ncbi:MAG: bifunctional riboflavin kinase/FAD synthetase [Firmicutes bacterium]|nr:bifunctional riboflavin kinase/FAD synthetase [Bacillota bacterium]
MKIFKTLEEIHNMPPTAVALGNFDGVHKGHQMLIRECVAAAKEKGLEPSVFTFTNHPVNEIAGKTVIKNIMTFEEKAAQLEELGVENLFSPVFDDSIRTKSALAFVKDIMVDRFHTRHAVCGFNYHFGYKAEGDAEKLAELGRTFGYGVSVIPEIRINGNTVSSTLIRSIIDEGRIDEYKDYTGRLYCIDGKVVQGKHLGRRIGFPTVNLSLDSTEAFPKNGVYITQTTVNDRKYQSITNVGNKPTVGEFAKNAETHIFDFDGDLYGQEVRVEFIKMLRPERKFDSLEDLQAEIHRNCLQAQEYFRTERSLP